MTSVRCMKTKADSNFNPDRHAWRIAIRAGAVPGIGGMVVLLSLIMANLYIGFGQSWQDGTVFLMQIMDTPEIYLLLLPIWGFMQAAFLFQFLFNRKAACLYFSFGMQRDRFFRIRFLAGAVWLVAAILCVTLVVLGFNLYLSLFAIRHINTTIAQSLFVAAGLMLSALLGYALSTLVGVLAGTIAEFLVCCLAALAAPFLLIWSAENLLPVFLWGNALSVRVDWSYQLPGELILNWLGMHPILLMARLLDPTAAAYLPAGPLPAAVLMAGWLLLLAGSSAAAGFFFVRRRVERTGMRGAFKPLGLVLLLPVLAAFATEPLHRAYLSGTAFGLQVLGMGTLLSTAVFFVAAYWFGWLKKGHLKGLLIYPAFLVIMGLSILVLWTGGLGYVGYRPEADAVLRVNISYKGIPALVVRNLYAHPINGLIRNNYNRDLILTGPDDIRLARDLHQVLINQHRRQEQPIVQTGTLVRYTLKNGREVTRFYPRLDMTALESLLALDQTDAFHSLLSDYLNGRLPAQDDNGYFSQAESPLATGVLYLAAPLADTAHHISEPLATQIRQALQVDLSGQTLEQRYRPDALEQYVLYFYDVRHQQKTDWPAAKRLPELDCGYTVSLAIDQSHPATLALLDAVTQLPDNKQIEWISIAGAYWDQAVHNDPADDFAASFLSFSLDERQQSNRYFSENHTAVRVTDPAQISALYAVSRRFYFAGDNGTVILVKLADSDVLIARYVPRDLLPPGIS